MIEKLFFVLVAVGFAAGIARGMYGVIVRMHGVVRVFVILFMAAIVATVARLAVGL